MDKGPVFISSCLRNKYQNKLIVPDIHTEIDNQNKPVFKIPITNKTERHIILPVSLQIGIIIFLDSKETHSHHKIKKRAFQKGLVLTPLPQT